MTPDRGNKSSPSAPPPAPSPSTGGWGGGVPPPPSNTGRARALRRRQTDAERRLWQLLRYRQVEGVKFRRQHPMGRYVVDFVALSHRLIVELDGAHHHQNQPHDLERDAWLRGRGFEVIRFSDRDVLLAPHTVAAVIYERLTR